MLNASEGRGAVLVSAGDVMGWLGAFELTEGEGVRMGAASTRAGSAMAGGNAGAVDCASGGGDCGAVDCASGGGRCGAGGDCAGGGGRCGDGGDCAGY